jgi:hypothetical protein
MESHQLQPGIVTRHWRMIAWPVVPHCFQRPLASYSDPVSAALAKVSGGIGICRNSLASLWLCSRSEDPPGWSRLMAFLQSCLLSSVGNSATQTFLALSVGFNSIAPNPINIVLAIIISRLIIHNGLRTRYDLLRHPQLPRPSLDAICILTIWFRLLNVYR